MPASNAYADQLIVISKNLNSYQQVAQSIAENLQAPSRIITLAEFKQKKLDFTGFQHFVTVGSKAADLLFTAIPAKKPLYVSFIPRQTFNTLLKKHAGHKRIKLRKVTAIYIDQPYKRKMALAHLIIPHAKTIATALGPTSQNDLKLLEDAASKEGFKLNYEMLQEADNPIHKLQPLIKNSDIFLALPDRSVFNRTTAKWILYISFRQRIPLIGFSKKYVDAGAIAAVYSTPEQVGKHTAEVIKSTKKSDRLPPPKYPKYFSVTTNTAAAHSLRMSIPSEKVLAEKLQGAE